MMKKLDNLVLGRHNTIVTKYLTNHLTKDYQMMNKDTRTLKEMYSALGLQSLYKPGFEIQDWAGNVLTKHGTFKTFEDTWEYILEKFPTDEHQEVCAIRTTK